jgi:iron complex outermembrane receptor protein
MEPVNSTETTIGFFAGFNAGGFDIDVGARWDDIERDGIVREMHLEEEHEGEHDEEAFELEPFTYSDQSVSGAVTIGHQLCDSLNASLNLGVVNRAPSATELFMNGEHLAIARYELGDANLDSERSNNIDLGLSYAADDWFANISVYLNRVDNYIYLQDEMDDDHGHEEEGHEAEIHEEALDEHDHEGLLMASYVQNDANFSGYEIELGRRFALAGGELEVRLQRDEVNADFAGGGDVPRITPARNVLAFDYTRGMTNGLLELQDIESQSTVADFETATDGFTLVNARLSHSVELGERAVLVISAYGRNLTDEVARNHTSFVKNEVPLAGRNIGIKARLSF